MTQHLNLFLKQSFVALFCILILSGCKNTGGTVQGWVNDLTGKDSVSLRASQTSMNVNENSSAAVLVLASQPVKKATSYSWVIRNADARVSPQSGSGELQPGEDSLQVQFNVANNFVHEGNRTATLEISGANITSTVTVTIQIIDDDPDLALSIADLTAAENSGNATATISLSSVGTSDITVDWSTSNGTATAGADYSASSGTATITAGSTSTTISVPITNDSTACESNETFSVTLANPSGGASISQATATMTITDDDRPTLTVSPVTVAAGATADFTASLSSTCPVAVTFDYATTDGTATSGTHYTSTMGTATITAGQATTTVNVSTLPLTLTSAKTFTLNLSNVASGVSVASSTVTGTIAAPSLDLNLTSSLPASVTFSRASLGSYFDSDRTIRYATSGTPRFDHDPVTGKPLGLLVEESRSNLLLNTANLTPSWSAGSSTIRSGATTAPDGSMTGVLFREDSTTASHTLSQTSQTFTAGSVLTFSAFVKPATRTAIRLNLYKASSNFYANFDLTGNGSYQSLSANGSATASAAQIMPLRDGWYRVSITGKVDASSTTADAYFYLLNSASGSASYAGALQGVYIWGAQLEIGSSATSYIPTGTATVTRSSDSATVSDVSWFIPAQGVLVGEATSSRRVNGTGGTNECVASVELNANNRIQIRRSPGSATSTESAMYFVGGSTQYSHYGPADTWPTTTTRRQLIGFSSTKGIHAYEGTVTQSTPTLTAFTPTQLVIGGGVSVSAFNGSIASVQFYPTLLNALSYEFLSTRSTAPVLYIEDATSTEGTDLVFTVKLTSALSSAVTATWSATSGSATLGTDTTGASSGTVTIPAGSTSATISIPTVDDATIENAETPTISLSGLPTSVTAGDTNAIGTIQDATLNFNFTNYPLVNGISLPGPFNFSRTSSATYFDSTGKIVTSPSNLLLQSGTLSQSPWTLSNASIVPSQVLSPDGSSTMWKLVEDTAATVGHFVKQTVTGLAENANYTASFYVKAGERVSLQVRLSGSSTANRVQATFDLSNGTVGSLLNSGNASGVTATITDLTNGYYRCAISGVPNNVAGSSVMFDIHMNASSGGSSNYNGDGSSGMYIWGAQLESGTTATPYIPTTTAATYAPRYEYDPETCADGTSALVTPGCTRKLLGLLIEPASTNMLKRSAEFDHNSSSWVRQGLNGVTANTTTAPDSSSDADTVTESATTDQHQIYQSLTTVANASYTLSVFVKPTADSRRYIRVQFTETSPWTSQFSATFDLTDGTYTTSYGGTARINYADVVEVGNGWRRLIVSGQAGTNTSSRAAFAFMDVSGVASYAGSTSKSLYFWGAQVEQGGTATSYFATSAVPASRSADILTTYSHGWEASSGSQPWSAIAQFYRTGWEGNLASVNPVLYSLFDATNTNNSIRHEYDSANSIIQQVAANSGVDSAGAGGAASLTAGTHTVGFSYDGTQSSYFRDGNQYGSNITVTLPTINALTLGADAAGANQWRGYLRGFQYIPRALTSSQMQSFTP